MFGVFYRQCLSRRLRLLVFFTSITIGKAALDQSSRCWPKACFLRLVGHDGYSVDRLRLQHITADGSTDAA